MNRVAPAVVLLVMLLRLPGAAGPAGAQPSGSMTFGVHVTLATRWLDTSETDAETPSSWSCTRSTTRW